jgi:hypothetical protein
MLWIPLVGLFTIACGSDADEPSPTPRPQPTATTAPERPSLAVEPEAGPPGTEITVTGSGWEPGTSIDLTGKLAPGIQADPYKTVTSNADGEFKVSFRLEETPDGTDLATGRYDLIARSAGIEMNVPFLVETRRPIQGNGPGG